MARTTCHIYRLGQLFPPNDEYAATVARLCLLWEDFITAAGGGASASIPDMDGNSPQWRRFYFLRNSIGTLHEIRKAVHHLQTQQEFKDALSRQPQADRISFQESCGKLVEREDLIKDLRDKIAGGHVLQYAVREGLNKMDSEMHGMIKTGRHYGDIRFRFAHGLALETMFPGHTDKNADTEIESLLVPIGDATHHALRIIEFVFSIYTKERRVSPL